jgi:hypothetical protein
MSILDRLSPEDRSYAIALGEAHRLPGNAASGFGEALLVAACLLSIRAEHAEHASGRLRTEQEISHISRILECLYGAALPGRSAAGASCDRCEHLFELAERIGRLDAASHGLLVEGEPGRNPEMLQACFAVRMTMESAPDPAFITPFERISQFYWQGAAPVCVQAAMESRVPGQSSEERHSLEELLGAMKEEEAGAYVQALRARAADHARGWLRAAHDRPESQHLDTLSALHQWVVGSEVLVARTVGALPEPAREPAPAPETPEAAVRALETALEPLPPEAAPPAPSRHTGAAAARANGMRRS